MKPKLPITNPEFRYTPSIETDIRKTFQKEIERQLERQRDHEATVRTDEGEQEHERFDHETRHQGRA